MNFTYKGIKAYKILKSFFEFSSDFYLPFIVEQMTSN